MGRLSKLNGIACRVVLFYALLGAAQALSNISNRFFGPPRRTSDKPKLILIGGSPGTGKSTFGMSVALDQGILKCISTDTVRAVMRSFVNQEVSPALHRSSYAPAFDGDDPVRSWKETCTVLHASVEGLVNDAIERGVSLVVEGVHVLPSTELTQKWEAAGGVAIGCILRIKDPEKHKIMLRRRGSLTGHVGEEEKKIEAFDRLRAIQEEMMRLADEANWLQIEQRTEADPLEMIDQALLFGDDDCATSALSSATDVLPKDAATPARSTAKRNNKKSSVGNGKESFQ